MVSSHDFVDDKRNKNIKIYINGKFYKRKDAKISVFDSSTMLGDGIWDSLRYHNNNFIFQLIYHNLIMPPIPHPPPYILT